MFREAMPWVDRLEKLHPSFHSWPHQGCPCPGEQDWQSCTPLFHKWPMLGQTVIGEPVCGSCAPLQDWSTEGCSDPLESGKES